MYKLPMEVPSVSWNRVWRSSSVENQNWFGLMGHVFLQAARLFNGKDICVPYDHDLHIATYNLMKKPL